MFEINTKQRLENHEKGWQISYWSCNILVDFTGLAVLFFLMRSSLSAPNFY